MSDYDSRSGSRHEHLGNAFGGGGPAPSSFTTKAEYERMIHSHNWRELRPDPRTGPKTMVVYSGTYNENGNDLHPEYEKMAGARHGEPVEAYKVAQGQTATNANYVTLGDTKVGQALAQAEKDKKFTKSEMDSLWSQASSEYAKAAAKQSRADGTAVLSYTRNAGADSVYTKHELPQLQTNAKTVFSDEPMKADGTPPRGDVWPRESYNNKGGITMH